MSDAERLAAARDEMLPERDRLVAEYEAQREEARAIGQRIRGMDAQIAALERQHGDEQAIEALRARGGSDGALAARTIAATMPDADRAARFEALAQELLSP
jgi:hypothetical protein